MKIVIIGAGAVGQLFAALLAQDGKHEIVLVETADAVRDAINAQGVCCSFGDKTYAAKCVCTTADGVSETADLTILCTKTPDSETALTEARAYMDAHTCVMSVQNGLGNAELIKRFADADHTWIGMCTYSSDRTKRNAVRSSGEGIIKLMPLSGVMGEKIQEVEALFCSAGLNCEAREDVWQDIWQKAAYNAALNSTSAVCRLPCGGMGILNKGMDLCNNIVDETCQVAIAYGVELDATRVKNDLRRKIFGPDKDHITSMAQDVIRKQRTEVGSINGAIVKYAAAKGMNAPYNEAMFCLIRSIESTYDLQVTEII
ncbi:MAG: ketopantoate reductase family protein [Atopobiaceae bacterium]|jgi:2-dehydropantoate 2-reductase